MSRYDPFAYGQVRLDANAKPAGAPPAGAPPAGPDDMLFAEALAVKQAPPADPSWALLEESVDQLLPGGGSPAAAGAVEFGADILGETVDEPQAAVAPAPSRPKVATAPRASAGSAAGQPATTPNTKPSHGAAGKRKPAVVLPPVAPTPTVSSAELAAKAAQGAKKPSDPPRRSGVLPMRRGRPLAAILLPSVLTAGGGTAATWFWLTQQNPVMAGIVGLLSLVGAAFARLLLRG
jgi:hypothetical protein